jgi:phage shock protein E
LYHQIIKQKVMSTIETMIKEGKATIIDVRSRGEFMGGHVAGSVNIPLQEIPDRIEEFKNMKNIVLCCASGNRSGQATLYLKTKWN